MSCRRGIYRRILFASPPERYTHRHVYISRRGGLRIRHRVGTEALYTALRGINKTKYAVVTGLAASGAYYVAVAAERIYATPSSWVGSIGVIAVLWPEEYLYDIPDYIYTTGPLKYHGKDLADYYNDIERVRLNFVEAVLKGRAGRIKTDPAVFETAVLFPAA